MDGEPSTPAELHARYSENAKCNVCGRTTCAPDAIGKPCDFPQPDGRKCGGVMCTDARKHPEKGASASPTFEDDRRAFKIGCAGKRGEYLHPDDLEWLAAFYRRYPNWYRENRDRVHQATKPYGAI